MPIDSDLVREKAAVDDRAIGFERSAIASGHQEYAARHAEFAGTIRGNEPHLLQTILPSARHAHKGGLQIS